MRVGLQPQLGNVSSVDDRSKNVLATCVSVRLSVCVWCVCVCMGWIRS